MDNKVIWLAMEKDENSGGGRPGGQKDFSEDEAILEASRCIRCEDPVCVQACPVRIDIPRFLKRVKEGRFLDADFKLKAQAELPMVCERLCPDECRCEVACVLGEKAETISILELIRFADDFGKKYGEAYSPKSGKRSPRSRRESIRDSLRGHAALGRSALKDVRWVAQRLGVTSNTVHMWINDRHIPFINLGIRGAKRIIRFDPEIIEDWLRERTHTPKKREK